MNVQFTENKLISLYIEIDDLYLAYQEFQVARGLGSLKKPTRKPNLSPSEVCVILAMYHVSGYKCFEYYYRQLILDRYNSYFPKAPKYESFIAYIPKAIDLIYLWLLYSIAHAKKTGIYFVDSKKLEACHLKREHSNKVFKGLARKGKTSTGWFFGFKIHLVINNLGEIISVYITSANVADNNHGVLKKMLKDLEGICIGDKGYLSKLFQYFLEQGLHLLTKPKKNQRPLPVKNTYNLLINKRAVVESVFDILTTICDIDHTRHRKPINALVHTLSGLIAYQHLDQKPRVFLPSLERQIAQAA